MFWKKSILTKLLLGIIMPVMLILTVAALFILQEIRVDITNLTQNELMARSQSAAFQVSEFFTKYIELVRQMGCNETILEMLKETKEPGASQAVPAYAAASKSLDHILGSDANVSLVWTADFDSGESVRSGGVVRGKLTDYDITSRSWYEQTMNHDSVFITEPYEDSSTGKIVASIILPVYDGTAKIGLVAIDLSVDSLKTMMSAHTIGDTGFFTLTTSANNLVYYRDNEQIGKNISELALSDNIKAAFTGEAVGSHAYQIDGEPVRGYLSAVGDTGWKVLTGLPETEFFREYNAICRNIVLIFAGGLLIMAVVILLIATGIIRPLKHLKIAANKIADGDLAVDAAVRSKDEVGQVSDALNRTVGRLRDYIKYIDELSGALMQIGEGNLDCSLTLNYVGEFVKLKEALNKISVSLSQVLGQINIASEQVASGADQVASGAQALSQSTTEQASSIEELSATIQEIASQVKKTEQSAEAARAQADNASLQVEDSNHKMQEMIAAINNISGKSAEIGKIVKTIEDIAFQTNILALNAAVEAARAGDAGRGFAVVADEVRNLAGKSAEAAKNTTALIGETISAVRSGTRLADDAAKAMSTVVENTHAINGLIDEISTAVSSQTGAIQEVRAGVEQISNVVQTNSATAEESAAVSEELSGQAGMLKAQVSHFRLRGDTGISSTK